MSSLRRDKPAHGAAKHVAGKETLGILFHVAIEVHDTIVLEGDKLLRQAIGPQMQHAMESGKVQASGIFGGKRGGFFLVDVDQVEELYELFGPCSP